MSEATRTAVVAGAGIAGLASALGLAQAGWQVTVLELAGGAPVPARPAGAHAVLGPHAEFGTMPVDAELTYR